MAKTAKKAAAKKPAKKAAKKAALPPGIKAVKNKIAKHDAKRAVKAGKPTKGKAAKKAPNPQQIAKLAAAQEKVAAIYANATAAGAAKAAAAMGMTPAVHDFAQAFKAMIGEPPKRSAASLLGDDPPPFNGMALKELVAVFVADNARLGELTMAAKQGGFDPQAFSIVAVLSLPYMRKTKAAVELYMKVLADG